ncbi:hypothetical protein FQN60_017416, partial [Etheostoma spectabile]
MSPPRLTGALRSFSNVSKKEDFTEHLHDLKTKRLKRRELFAREGLTWQKIVHFCSEDQDKAKRQAANQELKSLLLAAKEIAEASCVCVARLVAPLGESRVENFIQTLCSRHNPQRGSAFGRNIVFSYDCYTLDPLEDLPCSGIDEEDVSLDFINFLNNQQSGRKGVSEGELSSSGRSLSSGDGAILRTEVEKYLNGGNMISSSPEELCTSLFEMLASRRSDDELQNE